MPIRQTSFDFDTTPGEQVEVKVEERVMNAGEREEVKVEDREVKTGVREEVEVEVEETDVKSRQTDEVKVEVEQKSHSLVSKNDRNALYVESPSKKSTRGRMKLSDMNACADLVQLPSDEVLFQKSYYSIGSVSEMFNVNASLIRFWENEFDILKPKKNSKGDRFFRPEDVKNLRLIYYLLRERKYTIEGAKDFLKKNKKADEKYAMIESLKKIKAFLLELKTNL